MQANRLCRDDVHQRPPLNAREDLRINLLRVFLFAQHQPSSRPAQRLVRRRRHEIGVRHRARVQTRRHQPRDVRDIRQVALLAGMEGLTLLRRIVLPSARLPILAIGLLAFLVSWKEYFYSFVVSSGENSRTLPLLLSAMMAGEVPQWHLLFALSVVLILPGIALVTVATRMGISGRTEGGARD